LRLRKASWEESPQRFKRHDGETHHVNAVKFHCLIPLDFSGVVSYCYVFDTLYESAARHLDVTWLGLEEGYLCTDSEVHSEGAHPLCSALSWQGLDPIKLAYKPSRPDGRLKLTATTFNQHQPAVLNTGPIATQNSPFLPQRWPRPSRVLTAPTHGGMARLSGPEWPGKYRDDRPAKGRHQSQCYPDST